MSLYSSIKKSTTLSGFGALDDSILCINFLYIVIINILVWTLSMQFQLHFGRRSEVVHMQRATVYMCGSRCGCLQWSMDVGRLCGANVFWTSLHCWHSLHSLCSIEICSIVLILQAQLSIQPLQHTHSGEYCNHITMSMYTHMHTHTLNIPHSFCTLLDP